MEEVTTNQLVFDVIKSLGITIGLYKEDWTLDRLIPGNEPEMPNNIGSLSDRDLGDLLFTQSEWAALLSDRLSEFRSQLVIQENNKTKMRATLFTASQGSKVSDKKAEIENDPHYVQILDTIALLQAIIVVIEAALESANKRYSQISRQITLRGQDIDREVRNNGASYGSSFKGKPVVGRAKRAL